MNHFRHFIIRFELASFVLLTYLFSWAFIVPAEGGLIPQGPMLAAFLVLAVVSGRQGVGGLWQQMNRWRVAWKWYLIAPGFLIVANLFALGINLMVGAQIVNTSHLQSLPTYVGILVPLVFLGGQWEEPGWLGYALRRLQGDFANSPLAAALITGLMRMIWHSPLLVAGAISWYDFLFTSFALQLIFTWLYNRTERSVLIPMIGHFFSNILFATIHPLFGGADQERYYILLTVAESAIALGLVAATRGMLGRKSEGPHTISLWAENS